MNCWAITSRIKSESVDPRCDRVMDHFVDGFSAVKTNFTAAIKHTEPMIIRGLKFSSSIVRCVNNNRNFYYVDNGYFGNGKQKELYRITKNDIQLTGNIIKRDNSRVPTHQFKTKPFSTGSRILICPPSDKVLSLHKETADNWISNTVNELALYTDRPIVIRHKPTRKERILHNSFEQALLNDIHAVVTHSSIAGVESVLWGKPVFVSTSCAASAVANTDLSKIEKPWFPADDLRWSWIKHLSYGQFTLDEISNGTALRIIGSF
jgi:hypothetical protein